MTTLWRQGCQFCIKKRQNGEKHCFLQVFFVFALSDLTSVLNDFFAAAGAVFFAAAGAVFFAEPFFSISFSVVTRLLPCIDDRFLR